MIKSKKSQSAIEFVLLLSFMLFIFLGIFVLIQEKIITVANKNDQQYLAEINSIVLDEVSLAQKSIKDYHHSFFLPTHIMGKPYNIELKDGEEIILTYSDKTQLNFLTGKVTGILLLGENSLHNIDGHITVYSTGTTFHYPEYEGIFLNVNPEMCFRHNFSLTCEKLNEISPEYITYCQDFFGLCMS